MNSACDDLVDVLAQRHGLSVERHDKDDGYCHGCRMYIRCSYVPELWMACSHICSSYDEIISFKEELSSFDMEAFQSEFIALSSIIDSHK